MALIFPFDLLEVTCHEFQPLIRFQKLKILLRGQNENQCLIKETYILTYIMPNKEF